MDEYDAGYFAQINAEEAPQAERLADVLTWHYQPASVIDIGCASGLYLKPFLERGIRVTGVDYAVPATADGILQVPRKFIKIVDITKRPINKTADLTICLEVLEHIDAKYAHTCVMRLASTSDTIIFTAAAPGQGGVGHVNCQPKEYWQTLFAVEGFGRDYQDEDYLRTIMLAGYHMGWFTNNLMVFKKS